MSSGFYTEGGGALGRRIYNTITKYTQLNLRFKYVQKFIYNRSECIGTHAAVARIDISFSQEKILYET